MSENRANRLEVGSSQKPETPAHGGVEAIRDALAVLRKARTAYVNVMQNRSPVGETSADRRHSEGEIRSSAEEAMFEEFGVLTFEQVNALLALSPPATEDAASPAPGGWKLVPVEPTEEMCRAAVWALDRAREADGLLQEPRPYKGWEKHAIRYRAMLAATPAPAKAAGVGVPSDEALMRGFAMFVDTMQAPGHPEIARYGKHKLAALECWRAIRSFPSPKAGETR